jgi:hypothetical protein
MTFLGLESQSKIYRSVKKYGVKGAVCGLRGTYPAGVSVPLKPEECHLLLPSPVHACPRHGPWKCLWTAKLRNNWDKPAKGDNPDKKS